MRLCAITNRKCLRREIPRSAGEEPAVLERRLHDLAARWIHGGVDFIQLREKDLDLLTLRRFAGEIFDHSVPSQSKLLINLPNSPAGLFELAPVADGVHLPGRPMPGAAESVRSVFRAIGRRAVVSFSCHTLEDVRIAREERADLVLFAPVFEKGPSAGESLPGSSGQGLGMLKLACEEAREMPVFALGGVTAENASRCVAAGAAGVAGIRLFAGEDWRLLRTASSGPEPGLPFREGCSTDI